MCKRLGIIELDYFGLQFTGPKGETLWLNTRNRIRRQISGTPPYRLQFRVKFFVQPQYLLQDSTRYNLKMVYEFVNRGNGLNHNSLYYFPLALSSTVAYLSCWVEWCQLYTQMLPFFLWRHQYFLHLKNDLEEGKIIPDPEKAAAVYALIAQATIGDHGDSYSPCDYCQASEIESQWSSEFRSSVSEEHAKLKGVRSAAAKQFFIKELSLMENYGIEYHLAKNESGNTLHIGVGSEEIKIFDADFNFVER